MSNASGLAAVTRDAVRDSAQALAEPEQRSWLPDEQLMDAAREDGGTSGKPGRPKNATNLATRSLRDLIFRGYGLPAERMAKIAFADTDQLAAKMAGEEAFAKVAERLDRLAISEKVKADAIAKVALGWVKMQGQAFERAIVIQGTMAKELARYVHSAMPTEVQLETRSRTMVLFTTADVSDEQAEQLARGEISPFDLDLQAEEKQEVSKALQSELEG